MTYENYFEEFGKLLIEEEGIVSETIKTVDDFVKACKETKEMMDKKFNKNHSKYSVIFSTIITYYDIRLKKKIMDLLDEYLEGKMQEEKEYETTYNDDGVECPVCGYVDRDIFEYDYAYDDKEFEWECYNCKAKLFVEPQPSVTYVASVKKGDKNAK